MRHNHFDHIDGDPVRWGMCEHPEISEGDE